MQPRFTFDKRTGYPDRIFGWMIVLLLGVGCLGMVGLNRDAMWYDEIYSYIYAGGEQYGPIPVAEVYTRVVSQLEHEKNPPGYYLLLHFWLTVTGSSAVAGRLLSLLVGLLSVALTYRLGRDYAASAGVRQAALVGFGAAAVVGTSAYYGYYLHELRVYTLVVACTAFEVWAYLKLVERQPTGVTDNRTENDQPGSLSQGLSRHQNTPVNTAFERPAAEKAKRSHYRRLQVAFVVVTGASLYMHYQLLFVVVVIGLYHLVMVPKDARWCRVTLLIGAVGILVLPWVWTVITFSEGNTINAVVGLDAATIIPALALTFSNNSAALLGLVVLFAVYKAVRSLRMIVFMVVAGVVATLAANAIYPFINQIRYIVFLWPLLAVLVGLGIERLSRTGVAPAVLLGLWAAAGLWTMAANDFSGYLYGIIPSWREFRTTMETQAQAADVVVYHAGNYDWIRSLELDHYLYGLPLTHQMMEYLPGKPENDDYYNHARAFLADKANVWLVVSHIDPPNFRLTDFQRAFTDEGYSACYTALDDESMTVSLLARIPTRVTDMPLQYGAGIGLQLVEALHVNNDGQVRVVLGSVKATDVADNLYSVALHVVDTNGNLVSQSDFGLPNGRQGCVETLLTVPTGTYSLRVAVYNWQSGERLIGTNSNTGEQADRLSVTSFTVP